jgi:hypothetical protein
LITNNEDEKPLVPEELIGPTPEINTAVSRRVSACATMLEFSVTEDDTEIALELGAVHKRKPSKETGIVINSARKSSSLMIGKEKRNKSSLVLVVTLIRAKIEKKIKGEIYCTISLLTENNQPIKKEKFHTNASKGAVGYPEWGETFTFGLNSHIENATWLNICFEVKGLLGMNKTLGELLIGVADATAFASDQEGWRNFILNFCYFFYYFTPISWFYSSLALHI